MPTEYELFQGAIINYLINELNWRKGSATAWVLENRVYMRAMCASGERVADVATWIHQMPDRTKDAQ